VADETAPAPSSAAAPPSAAPLAAAPSAAAPSDAAPPAAGSPAAAPLAAPSRAEFDEAVRLHQGKRLAEAEEIYRRVLAADPRHAGALHLLGVIDIQRGAPAAAIEKIGAALALKADAAPFHCNLATALQAVGRADEALAHYRRAVALDPNYADAHNNLGALLEKRGARADAAAAYRRAIAAGPTPAAAHHNLAQILRLGGRTDEAIPLYRRALELNPDYAEAHHGLGAALTRKNQVEEAIAEFRRAVALKPDYAEAWNNLGNRLKQQGKAEEAEACYRKALAASPNFVDAWNNLGNLAYRRGRLDEAEGSYRRALAINPNYADGHGNLGIVHMGRCDYDAAIAGFRRALALKRDYPEGRCNLSQALLVTGNFAEGWPLYEWRWRLPGMSPRPFAPPLWNGFDRLEGKTILLHAEQGFGDAIQFARYAGVVERLGAAQVLLEAPRELMRLFRPLARGRVRLVERGKALPGFDLHCPLLGVPGALDVEVATIPGEVPYLAAEPELAARWRARLGDAPGLRVGFVWAGNRQHGNDHNRSVRPLAFKAAFAVEGVRWFCLQRERRDGDAADLAALGPFDDLAPELEDFADTAAALANLDLLVSADTSIVHLAGALARPVWNLVPFSPDWRWLTGREDTPWYPTMRLLRQAAIGAWGPLMERVAADLRDLLAGRRHAT
jgi:tetratricopeptide (TPR) repeat protein